MSDRENPSSHPVALGRLARAWSQADLAAAAGIPRSTISAIESRRLTPSVTAALAVAAALGGTVEELFGSGKPGEEGAQWAWPPVAEPCRYWEASVGTRKWLLPVENTSANGALPDGVWRSGVRCPRVSSPQSSLVVACCDPASGYLAREYEEQTGYRMLILERGGIQALEFLRRGIVHAAGLHFSTPQSPARNVEFARRELSSGFHLLRAAIWEEGLALPPKPGPASVAAILRRKLTWALREPGSAARDCLDELLESRPATGQIVRGHTDVARAVRSGWAGAGVCIRLSAMENALGFVPIRCEYLDLCISQAAIADPRVQALIRVVRSRNYRQHLEDLPGYDARQTGELLSC